MPGLTLLLVLALLAAAGSSPVVLPEPIRCAPCTQQTECAPVPEDCGQVLREPGCGCCMTCALQLGASCGVHTAHCGRGLRCNPQPGEERPLQALTRGQGVCSPDPQQEEAEVVSVDRGSLAYLLSLNLPLDQPDASAATDPLESIKAKVNALRSRLQTQGPCHIELHSSLEMIASSQQELGDKFTTFYLPNCDKHGFYKAKQCESSLVGPPARCWCVSSWNGKKLPGSSDLLGDSECHQEVTH